MKRKVRFTLVFDRMSRTATAALMASLERSAGGDCMEVIRPVPLERLSEIDFIPGSVEFVCMSSMTRDFKKRREALRMLRQNHGRAFLGIAGGPHATARPADALNAGFDYCCIGEGEEVVAEMYSRAASGASFAGVAGLMGRETGPEDRPIASGPADISVLDPLPRRIRFPAYIEAGRGCRWGCLYCQTPRLFGRSERFRSPEMIADISSYYARQGMKDLRILLPNALSYGSAAPGAPDCAALEEMLGRVASACRDARIYLGSFPSEVRPDYVTPEAIAVLRKYVSNRSLVIGGQSGSDEILRWLERGHTAADICGACETAAAGGFDVSVDLMLGFPRESPGDREATFDLAGELGSRGMRVNMHFLMPLPGTPLAASRPRFLSPAERRMLDRMAQQGIVRGSWRRQEDLAAEWQDRDGKSPNA